MRWYQMWIERRREETSQGHTGDPQVPATAASTPFHRRTIHSTETFLIWKQEEKREDNGSSECEIADVKVR